MIGYAVFEGKTYVLFSGGIINEIFSLLLAAEMGYNVASRAELIV